MASKLSRTIPPATPVLYVGMLRYFDENYGTNRTDLNGNILDFGSNWELRRVSNHLNKQVANLTLSELFTLIAPQDQWAIENDFYELEMRKDRNYAMEQLRLYLVENYFYIELIRTSYDQTAPLLEISALLAINLKYARKKVQQRAKLLAKRLRQLFRFIAIAPAIQWPQRLPNAPNTAPALSLVAA